MQVPVTITSANFGFLAEHDALFVQLAAAAERAFAEWPTEYHGGSLGTKERGRADYVLFASLTPMTVDRVLTELNETMWPE